MFWIALTKAVAISQKAVLIISLVLACIFLSSAQNFLHTHLSSVITIWCMTQTLFCTWNNGLRLHGCSEVLLIVYMQEHVQTWDLRHSVLLRGVLFPDQRFGTSYLSRIHGSRNPRRKTATLGSAFYMREGLGSDWFPVSVLPTCRL
jgi:hypothetical protein